MSTMGSLPTRTLQAPPRRSALILPALVVAAVTMLIVPIPTPVLDVLLAMNLALAVGVVLATLSSARALELSTFPALLVLTTLFRLALNVSSVRLILLKADAGRVIHAFGTLLVRGDVLTGLVLFAILALVQYMVIARGAERIAEVAARFALDALPGRQLEIDSELRDGHISLEAARARRSELQREAHLYGSLDGAMRLVRGDAIAGMIVLAVALVGGLAVGVLRNDLAPLDAIRVYSVLTVGDGLVTQIPALLLSVAAGLVVTTSSSLAAERGASAGKAPALGQQISAQVLRPTVLLMVGATFSFLALLPGLPTWPFAAVGALALAAGLTRRRALREAQSADEASILEPPPALELALEPHLVAALPRLGAHVAEQVQHLSRELAIPLPPLVVVADAALPLRGYSLRLRGAPLTSGALPDGKVLITLDEPLPSPNADALPARHPLTHGPALWVAASSGAQLGGEVLDGPSFLALSAVSSLRRHVGELIGLEETRQLLDRLAGECPALVRDVVPRRIDLPALTGILRQLAAEGLALGDLRAILETIAALGKEAPGPAALVEHVRRALRRQITHRFATRGELEAVTLDPMIEEALTDELGLTPDLVEELVQEATRAHQAHPGAVLLTAAGARPHARRMLADRLPLLPVLSFEELEPELELSIVRTLRPSTA